MTAQMKYAINCNFETKALHFQRTANHSLPNGMAQLKYRRSISPVSSPFSKNGGLFEINAGEEIQIQPNNGAVVYCCAWKLTVRLQ